MEHTRKTGPPPPHPLLHTALPGTETRASALQRCRGPPELGALLWTRGCLPALGRAPPWLSYCSDTDCETQRGASMRAAAKHAEEQQCGVKPAGCLLGMQHTPASLAPAHCSWGLVNMRTDDDVETA